MRDTALNYLQKREFDKLIELLKDNHIFNDLLDDHIFKSIFSTHFITELLNNTDDILYPAFLYNCHSSNQFSFLFDKTEEEIVLKFLIDKTKQYNFAKLLPEYETSKIIINNYEEELKINVEKGRKEAKKQQDFEVVEKYSNNTDNLLKSIFNSPQEKEFYIACKRVFTNHIILPNAAMSTLFNSTVVKEKYKSEFNYFLKATIDFTIVETVNFTPILFFELDSKRFHSTPETKKNDEIKNKLITELGKDLIRLTKRKGSESITEFTELLKNVKIDKNIA